MSQRLPSLRAQQAIRAFRRAGWIIARQSGSHITLVKDGIEEILTIPMHKGCDLKRGLLIDQIKLARLTIEEFIDLL